MYFVQQYPIIIPFFAILSAEVCKAFIDLIRRRAKIRFINPGGMPSGHSSFVASLVVVVAHREGVDSTAFMLAAVIALVVMYDAVNVRNESGKHAKAINKLSKNTNLEESLGHTRLEVIIGAIFGAIFSYFMLVL